MIPLKKILKNISIFILIVIVFYAGGYVGFRIREQLEIWKNHRANQAFTNEIIKLMKNDKDGGSTPEETYNLLISALKQENVELAVKYFVLDAERRDKYRKEFEEMKQQGKLVDYANKLPEYKDFKETDDGYYNSDTRLKISYSETINESFTVYDPLLKQNTVVPPGTYVQNEVIFIKNSNNIWKIQSF